MALLPNKSINIMLRNAKSVKIMKPIQCGDNFIVASNDVNIYELRVWLKDNGKHARKYLIGGEVFIYADQLGDSYFLINF